MNKTQIATVTVLALAVGGTAGYFGHLVRFPLRRQHPELFVGANANKPIPMVHPITAELAKARKLHEAGKLIEAQQLLLDQIHLYPQAAEAVPARELLGEINTELYFSNEHLEGKTEYVVQRGDSLARIANRLKSSPEMIMRANDLASTIIHPGERLLVPDGDFTLTVDLPKQRVVVHHAGGFFKQYPIQSIDLPGSRQPRLTTKVTATSFWKDGERVLPTRTNLPDATAWVHLARNGYILYGVSEENGVEPGAIEIAEREPTPQPAATPAPAAANPDIPPHGIALLKDDLAELQLLLSRGTPVTIIRERN